MKKLKVVTVVGTRPEIIRLSRLIPKLDQYTDHILVHTGQNYDRQLNEIFFQELEMRAPDYYLNVDTTSIGTVMGDTLKKSEEVFLKEKPDAVMILGDTNSAISALVAERMHIPVYHMEAGNRSFDKNVPEELNRRLVDHVASFNLPYTDHAMRNLLMEGLSPRFIHVTGSPVPEVFAAYKSKIDASTILQNLGLSQDEYFLASVHRQENVDSPDRLEQVLNSLRAIRDSYDLPVVISTHPRTRAKLADYSGKNLEGLIFHEPFGYLDYIKLQQSAYCVVSDSGTISEESSIIGFPAVSIRDSHERPEALEVGSIVLSGLSPSTLVQAVALVRSNGSIHALPSGYEVDNFSHRVLAFLLSTARLHHAWSNIRTVS